MKIKKNGKVINLTESDLNRIVRKTIKESQGEPMGYSISIEDIVSSIESELSHRDIDPGSYENEIYIAAGNIMEDFRYQLYYMDENIIFMDLLEYLREIEMTNNNNNNNKEL